MAKAALKWKDKMENREIDAAIAEKVFNWELMQDTGMTRSGFLTYRKMRNDWDWQETLVPEFSEDISAAGILHVIKKADGKRVRTGPGGARGMSYDQNYSIITIDIPMMVAIGKPTCPAQAQEGRYI